MLVVSEVTRDVLCNELIKAFLLADPNGKLWPILENMRLILSSEERFVRIDMEGVADQMTNLADRLRHVSDVFG